MTLDSGMESSGDACGTHDEGQHCEDLSGATCALGSGPSLPGPWTVAQGGLGQSPMGCACSVVGLAKTDALMLHII